MKRKLDLKNIQEFPSKVAGLEAYDILIQYVGYKTEVTNLKTHVSRKQTTSDFLMCVCISGGKKGSFFGKLNALCFLETPVFRFALLPYYIHTL